MSRPATLPLLLSIGLVALAASTPCVSACSAPETQEGIPRDSGAFDDLGAAPGEERVRAVVLLPVRERSELDTIARYIYDPDSSSHRMFLDRAAVEQRFLPTEGDVARTRSWAMSHGLEVHFVAANRLLVEIRGPVRAFNDALVTTLHAYDHRSRDQRVYGTPGGIQLPSDSGISALLTLDEPTDGEADADEPVASTTDPSSDRGYLPDQIAQVYGTKDFAEGRGGEGVTIALATGGAFRASDVRAFWKAVGIEREDAVVHEVAGAPSFRGLESTMLAEWVGVLAPKSRVVVFQGADARLSSTLLAFNEALGSGEAQIVAFSNSRHEKSEPIATREAFDLAAEIAATVGITVVAASGDTAEPDIPATCPFVTAVGGTTVVLESEGVREEAWARSGSGSSSFAIPEWQRDVASSFGGRVIPDVALNAGAPYLVLYEGRWEAGGGTSIATPVFAGIIALVDSARLAEGKKPLGFLNPTLYRDSSIRETFRDVTSGGTREHAASAGWDAVSGWGAPIANDFSRVSLDRVPH
jgi:kumamolisin